MLTREAISGAIRLVNANRLTPRLKHLEALLSAEGVGEEDRRKILADLDSYPAWTAGKELDNGS